MGPYGSLLLCCKRMECCNLVDPGEDIISVLITCFTLDDITFAFVAGFACLLRPSRCLRLPLNTQLRQVSLFGGGGSSGRHGY